MEGPGGGESNRAVMWLGADGLRRGSSDAAPFALGVPIWPPAGPKPWLAGRGSTKMAAG